MNYSIIVSSSRGIATEDGWHYGEILDAGKEGVRLRVTGFGKLSVGSTLQLICQPVAGKKPNNRCRPVPIKGMVVWENGAAEEFALAYLH